MLGYKGVIDDYRGDMSRCKGVISHYKGDMVSYRCVSCFAIASA